MVDEIVLKTLLFFAILFILINCLCIFNVKLEWIRATKLLQLATKSDFNACTRQHVSTFLWFVLSYVSTFPLNIVEIRFCCKLQQFCCLYYSTLIPLCNIILQCNIIHAWLFICHLRLNFHFSNWHTFL
jgi:hypothetical protein